MSNQQTTPPKKPDLDWPRETILIVDDTPANLRLLFQILVEQGYKVRVAVSGDRALETVQVNVPDLILLDIMMPDMDGYEVCRRLKADEKTRDIPIIFISALSTTENKIKAFTTGGVDYVTKPFQAEEVLARVRTHLTLRQLQQQLQQMNVKLLTANNSLKIRNKELDAFAHTVSHELKNPLHVIQGYSEWLASEHVSSEKSERVLNTINQTSQKMSSIVEALLLLAGVRKTEVVASPLDMGKIVAAAQKRLADMIAKYQAQIDRPPDWPVAIGYAPWIEEVWVNYLSNGLKYGGRPPHLTLGATTQANNMVQFWVQDNGPGLSPKEQAQLFVPFTRLTDLHVEGHGLGLSIVQQIMQKLEGQAGVESYIGQGSKFNFVLAGGG